MLRLREMRSVLEKAKTQGVSMQRRLVLYWFSMALAILAAVLLVVSLTGVFSNTAQKFGQSLTIQKHNTASALAGQMDQLTAQSIALSEELTRELDKQLAAGGRTFSALNDDPGAIAAVETALYPALNTYLKSGACSGAVFCLDATANTALPGAATSRAGLYLRYSALRAIGATDQHVTCFRGTAETARSTQVQMHNRWNPELNVQAVPGYTQLLRGSDGRLAERCLWTGRIALPDTWESVTLLCVPMLDSAGNVRGICGAELSDLYFRLTYPAVDSAYGSMVTVLAPIDGDRLLLGQAMIGSPGGSYLTADGTLTCKTGRYYNTYSDGSRTYLGLHEPIGATDAAGRKLAAVVLVPEIGLRTLEARSRMVWIAGSLVFLAAMLLLSTYLSRRFVTPISRSLQAIREQTPGEHPSGISEIDELLAFVRSRAAEQLTAGGLPPNIEELLSGFRDRVQTLTPMERTVLQYYIDGCSLEEVAARAYISVATAKKHNTNINRKLGVTSREELMLYIDLFRRCGRLDEIAAPRAEDTARCTT